MKKNISYYMKLVITLCIFITSILIIENIIPKISANEESVNIEEPFNPSEEPNESLPQEVEQESLVDESIEGVSLNVLDGYLSNIEKQKIKNESHNVNSFSASEAYSGIAYVKGVDEFIVAKNDNDEEFTISNFEVVQILADNNEKTKIKYNGEVGLVNTSDLVFNRVVSLPYYEVIDSQVFFYEVINPEIESENNYFPKEYFLMNSNLEVGVKYYSFDNSENYFPLSSLKKISINSNQKEFVQPKISPVSLDDSKFYFRNLSFRSKTNYTAAELDIYVEAMQNRYYGLPDNESCYFRTSKSALLYNARTGERLSSVGAVLKEAERKYGVNAMFILAMANHESCFGFSGYATSRNNFWGFMAYDLNPDAAAGFKTRDEGIYSFAKFLSNAYTDYTFTTYAGTHAGASPSVPNAAGVCEFDNDNESGVGTFWAKGCEWQDAVSKELSNIDNYLGAKDVNQKSMASIPFNSTFYKTPGGEVAYSVTRSGRENINLSLMVLKEVGDYYEVQPDTPIDGNKNAVLSDRWVITSPVNFNSPDGLIYRTDETNYDIRNTNKMFYYYKRTTGNIFGEYDNVVDNNRTLYIKKNIVKAIYGNQVIPKPETSKKNIEANFKAAGLYQDLVVFDVTAFYKDDQGKMQNLPSAPDVYLDIDDNNYNGNEIFATTGIAENTPDPNNIKVYSLRIPKSKLESMKNYKFILGVQGLVDGKISSDASRTTLSNTTFPTYGTVDVRNINKTVEFSYTDHRSLKNITADYLATGVYSDLIVIDMTSLYYYEKGKFEALPKAPLVYFDIDSNTTNGNEFLVTEAIYYMDHSSSGLPVYSIRIPKNKFEPTKNYKLFLRIPGFNDRNIFITEESKEIKNTTEDNFGSANIRNINNFLELSYNSPSSKRKITADYIATGIYQNLVVFDIIAATYYEVGKSERLPQAPLVYIDSDDNTVNGNEVFITQAVYYMDSLSNGLPVYSIRLPKDKLESMKNYKIFLRIPGFEDRKIFINKESSTVSSGTNPEYGSVVVKNVNKFLEFTYKGPLKNITADFLAAGLYSEMVVIDMTALHYYAPGKYNVLPEAPLIYLDTDDNSSNGNEILVTQAIYYMNHSSNGLPVYSIRIPKSKFTSTVNYHLFLRVPGFNDRNIFIVEESKYMESTSNPEYGSTNIRNVNNFLQISYNSFSSLRNITADYIATGIYRDLIVFDVSALYYFETGKFELLPQNPNVFIDIDNNTTNGNEVLVSQAIYYMNQSGTALPIYSIRIPKSKLLSMQNYKIFLRIPGFNDRNIFIAENSKTIVNQNYGSVKLQNVNNFLQFTFQE